MANLRSDDGGRLGLAYLGVPVGAPGDDPVLPAVCERPAEGDHGLADGSSLHGRSLVRRIRGILARRLRRPQGMQLCQRGCGGSAVDLHALRASCFSRFPDLGHLVHGVFRLAVCGVLGLGLSACAHWTPSWMAKPVALAPVPAAPVIYQPQPRLGAAWQYDQPEPGLVHVLGKQMPAIVNIPSPVIVHPTLIPAHSPRMPQQTIPFPIRKPAFHIPEAWFKAGAKRQHIRASIVNPWSCKPAALPCGKTGTDYWACQKRNTNLAPKGVRSCKP